MTQKPVIGILTLGQTPGPDLVAVVRAIVPNAELPIRGGFDGLSMEEIETFRAGPGAAMRYNACPAADEIAANVFRSSVLAVLVPLMEKTECRSGFTRSGILYLVLDR